MMEYYVCWHDTKTGIRNVSIYRCNSSDEARQMWTNNLNPYCYPVAIDFITTNKGQADGFRFGR